MSSTSIDRSVKAFEAELRRQVAMHGPLAGDPDELGRRAARAVAAGAAWAAEVGPFYDTAGAQEALGGVSKQAVSARATAGRLLALRLAPDGTARDRLVYPVWQFVPAVLRHLPRVLAAAGHDPERDASGWTVATWLTTPDPRFGDRTPLELLRADHVEQVLVAADDVAHALGSTERAALRAPAASAS
ncbi:MAG: antitoxin Xre/MbcA/ParS toxin-binding domain-containing protein [Acidimicrobiales bacterium]